MDKELGQENSEVWIAHVVSKLLSSKEHCSNVEVKTQGALN